MSYTKRQFIYEAFDEVGISPYVYTPSEEQLQAALFKLDNMLATWELRGIYLRYPFHVNPEDSSLDEKSNVPDIANEAICKNLAISLGPSYGKPASPETILYAKRAFDVLMTKEIISFPRQLPSGMPSGAGNKGWLYGNNFLLSRRDKILVGDDSELYLGKDMP